MHDERINNIAVTTTYGDGQFGGGSNNYGPEPDEQEKAQRHFTRLMAVLDGRDMNQAGATKEDIDELRRLVFVGQELVRRYAYNGYEEIATFLRECNRVLKQ